MHASIQFYKTINENHEVVVTYNKIKSQLHELNPKIVDLQEKLAQAIKEQDKLRKQLNEHVNSVDMGLKKLFNEQIAKITPSEPVMICSSPTTATYASKVSRIAEPTILASSETKQRNAIEQAKEKMRKINGTGYHNPKTTSVHYMFPLQILDITQDCDAFLHNSDISNDMKIPIGWRETDEVLLNNDYECAYFIGQDRNFAHIHNTNDGTWTHHSKNANGEWREMSDIDFEKYMIEIYIKGVDASEFHYNLRNQYRSVSP